MKQKYKLRHRFTALLLAFMLCLSCFAAPPAFALESSASEPASTSEANSAVESQSTPESAASVPETDSVIWLDNADYNADIATSYTGGTKLIFDGREATVTIYDQPQDAGRTYVTDSTGLANNEDSYTMIPQDDVFQNDRVLGEIILTEPSKR